MSNQTIDDLQHPSAVVTMEGLLVEMKNGGYAVTDSHLMGFADESAPLCPITPRA